MFQVAYFFNPSTFANTWCVKGTYHLLVAAAGPHEAHEIIVEVVDTRLAVRIVKVAKHFLVHVGSDMIIEQHGELDMGA
jgi:hypothetical protein